MGEKISARMERCWAPDTDLASKKLIRQIKMLNGGVWTNFKMPNYYQFLLKAVSNDYRYLFLELVDYSQESYPETLELIEDSSNDKGIILHKIVEKYGSEKDLEVYLKGGALKVHGIDVNAKSEYLSPLHRSIYSNNVVAVEMLLSHVDIDIDIEGYSNELSGSPLEWALQLGNVSIAKMIYESSSLKSPVWGNLEIKVLEVLKKFPNGSKFHLKDKLKNLIDTAQERGLGLDRDIWEHGEIPIFNFRDDYELLSILILRGKMNLSAYVSHPNLEDFYAPLLHITALREDYKMFHFLLMTGINPMSSVVAKLSTSTGLQTYQIAYQKTYKNFHMKKNFDEFDPDIAIKFIDHVLPIDGAFRSYLSKSMKEWSDPPKLLNLSVKSIVKTSIIASMSKGPLQAFEIPDSI